MVTPVGIAREVLGNDEEVLRGLNPKHCADGLPTEGCFIIKPKDPPDDGPSFGILKPGGPVGKRTGVSAETFSHLLPSPEFGIARLNVGEALNPIQNRGAEFVQKDDEHWGDYKSAHAMLTGYQRFDNQDRKDLQRHLARLAANAVLKSPAKT